MQELFTGKVQCSSDRGCSTSMWRWACVATWSQSLPKNSLRIDLAHALFLHLILRKPSRCFVSLSLGPRCFRRKYMPCLFEKMLIVINPTFFDATF